MTPMGNVWYLWLRLLPTLKSIAHFRYQSLENKSHQLHVPSHFQRLSEKKKKFKKSQCYLTCAKMPRGCFIWCGQKAAPRFLMQFLYSFARVSLISLQIQMHKFEPSFRPTYSAHVVESFHGWTSMEKDSCNSCLKSKSSICNFRCIILPYTTDYREPMNFSTLS